MVVLPMLRGRKVQRLKCKSKSMYETITEKYDQVNLFHLFIFIETTKMVSCHAFSLI